MEEAVISLKKITSCLKQVPDREYGDQKDSMSKEDEIRSHYLLYLKNIIESDVYTSKTIKIYNEDEYEETFRRNFEEVTLEFFHNLIEKDYKSCIHEFSENMKMFMYKFVADASQKCGIILDYYSFSNFCMNFKGSKFTAYNITRKFINESIIKITPQAIYDLLCSKNIESSINIEISDNLTYKIFVKRFNFDEDIKDSKEWIKIQKIICFCTLVLTWSLKHKITTYTRILDGHEGNFSLIKRIHNFIEDNMGHINMPVSDFMTIIHEISRFVMQKHTYNWYKPVILFPKSSEEIPYDEIFQNPPSDLENISKEISSIYSTSNICI